MCVRGYFSPHQIQLSAYRHVVSALFLPARAKSILPFEIPGHARHSPSNPLPLEGRRIRTCLGRATELTLKLCRGRRINVTMSKGCTTMGRRQVTARIFGITLVPVLVGVMTGDGGLTARG